MAHANAQAMPTMNASSFRLFGRSSSFSMSLVAFPQDDSIDGSLITEEDPDFIETLVAGSTSAGLVPGLHRRHSDQRALCNSKRENSPARRLGRAVCQRTRNVQPPRHGD